jgi:hypothetical protein
MLEIILIASGAFLAALFCVWVYRIARSMHDAKFRQVKLAGQQEPMTVSRESGTVELKLSGAGGSGNSRKPWGW